MDSAGIFSPTVGTPLTVIASRSARWVAIRNDSAFQVHVACGPQPPTSPSVASSYRMTIQPWSGDNYDTDSFAGAFDGVVYLLTTDPAHLASVANISSRNQVTIDTYVASESPPAPYSGIGRQSDLSSQPRVVSVLPALNAAQVLTTNNLAIPAAGVSQGIGGFGNPNDGANADIWFVYLYTLDIWPNGNNTNAGGVDFQILIDLHNGSDISVGFPWPQVIARGQMYWPAASGPPTPYHLPGPHPRSMPFSSNTPNLASVVVLFKTISVANAATGMSIDFQAYMINGSQGTLVNTSTGTTPGPIGFPGVSTAGAVY